MIDEKRAVRAFTDVLAVEHDEDTDLLRVVTLSDAHLVDDRDKLHQCPDRKHNIGDGGVCKHLVAALATTDEIDVPTGWLVVEDLEARRDASSGVDEPLPDFEDFEVERVATDGGQPEGA